MPTAKERALLTEAAIRRIEEKVDNLINVLERRMGEKIEREKSETNKKVAEFKKEIASSSVFGGNRTKEGGDN